MSDTMQSYQATKQGGSFTLATVPKPSVDPYEVSVRVKAVALNPLDWKMWAFGAMVQSWPICLGLDAAGVVESVGESVTKFQPGDEVFGLFGIGGKAACFQELATVSEDDLSLKPASLSFEEVASLPICYCTAASAIVLGLHVPIPHISSTAPGQTSSPPRSILVLGGSSGVGSAALQMLRSALPNATILTTASLQHKERLSNLGATTVINRSSSDIVSEVTQAVPGGVDAILDCVAAASGNPGVFAALRPDGPQLYSQVFTGDNVAVPEGVKTYLAFGRNIFDAPGGKTAMSSLGKVLEEGTYKLPLPVKIIGKGWEAVGSGLETFGTRSGGDKALVTI
ncbi:hypothetical protein FZEAL_1947 [Fusarium zealandicum]|uniref:Enoyl reductase (ER) domain-containing protein n=1 Tax=Fusarium zealandicum TaxID=1053134 RepID=A0A8H4US88_9HYPO|nr:hypothetical protein FZEAL_1947 [Fusarium zealandicum]